MTEIPAPQGAPQSDFASQYARLFEAAECRTQIELATLLDARQSSVSDAKRRQYVPANWLMKLFEKKQINPQWILTGLGGKTLKAALESGDATGTHVPFITVIERRPLEEYSTDELLAEVLRRATRVLG